MLGASKAVPHVATALLPCDVRGHDVRSLDDDDFVLRRDRLLPGPSVQQPRLLVDRRLGVLRYFGRLLSPSSGDAPKPTVAPVISRSVYMRRPRKRSHAVITLRAQA